MQLWWKYSNKTCWLFFLWAYWQHDSFLLYRLNLAWVFYLRLSSIFPVKVETFELNQVEYFMEKKKKKQINKKKQKNRRYYFWKIDTFKWSTRVTKLKILIKMFQAGRNRNVTHWFIEKLNLLYPNERSQFVKGIILFHLVINLTLSAFSLPFSV